MLLIVWKGNHKTLVGFPYIVRPYIQGWLDKLKNDKRFIISASDLAQKTVDFILKDPVSKEEYLEALKENGSN